MEFLEISFEYDFNLYNKCNPYTYIKVTHYMPHHPYSSGKQMFKSTIFMIFEFIIVHIQNPGTKPLTIIA